jgi:hypothetical protein
VGWWTADVRFGHYRPSCAPDKSVFHPIRDIAVTLANSRANIVGKRQNFIRNDEAQRLGCIQVNNEVEFSWLLDWDIAWLCPAKYLVNNLGRSAEQSRKVRPIRHESPGPRYIRVSAGCRQLGAERESRDGLAVSKDQSIFRYIKRVRFAL